jgi:LacI family transcriptional regulator
MKVPKVAILVDTATGWGRRVVRGVLDYTLRCGPWDILLEPRGQNEPFAVPPDPDIDGIIARVASVELVQAIKARKIPAVNVSGLIVKGCDFPRVTIDRAAAAALAEEHFKERALRHFAYAGPLHLSYVREHEQAFEKRVVESGTPCHLFQSGESLNPADQRSFRNERLIPWLRALPKPVGIFTWGFQIGREIISACRAANISVPHDIAVLGGDYDELLSDACHPALSGIITPAGEIGYNATMILHAMMQGRKAPQQPLYIKPMEIADRLSTDVLAIEDPRILQALTYLREHACDPITVEDILREVPMARRSLERRFMQTIGRNPAQEIRRLRINHARKLLSRSHLSMQEIAEACGYASYNYLGNIFKQETGISPGRYRNIARSRQ